MHRKGVPSILRKRETFNDLMTIRFDDKLCGLHRIILGKLHFVLNLNKFPQITCKSFNKFINHNQKVVFPFLRHIRQSGIWIPIIRQQASKGIFALRESALSTQNAELLATKDSPFESLGILAPIMSKPLADQFFLRFHSTFDSKNCAALNVTKENKIQ